MPLTITAITFQKKHRDRVNVFINHEYAFSGFAAALSRIKTGDVISESDVEAFKREDARHLAYSRVLRFLAFRSRSRKEVIDYLKNKGIDGRQTEMIMERLEKNGYINDAEFARMWVENRQRFKPKGRYALKWELSEKGIDEKLIDESLMDVDEKDAAWAAVLPRLNRWKDLEEKTLKLKVARFLGRRGFGYEICRHVFERIIEDLKASA